MVAALPLVTACCTHRLRAAAPASPGHRAGDDSVEFRGFYGIPILQKSFFWDGNGEVDAWGFGGRYLHYVTGWLAMGAGLTASVWENPAHDAYAGEIEGVVRSQLWQTADWRLFFDLTGGHQQSSERVPPGGTHWNFSFSGGPGLEIPLGPRHNLLVGASYHHISNALGHESPRNPSQNDARIWVGFSWTF